MALVACPECNNSVSDLALACPQCGRPLEPKPALAAEAPAPVPQGSESSSRSWVWVVLVLFALGAWGLLGRSAVSKPTSARQSPDYYRVGETNTATATPEVTQTPTNTLLPRTATAVAKLTAQADAVAAATATAQAIERETRWHYSESADDMGRGTERLAWTNATNAIDFGFPYDVQSATLYLRRSPKYGLDVFISFEKAHFLCNYDGCSVNVRFGDGKVQRFPAVEPSDHSNNTLFLRNEGAFIAALKRAPTVSIEAEFYQDGWRVMFFDTKHLKWK